MTTDSRIINGQLECKRYAYMHKKDPSRFGLLQAVDYRDARKHLGRNFNIRMVWITSEKVLDLMWDKDGKQKVVNDAINPKRLGR